MSIMQRINRTPTRALVRRVAKTYAPYYQERGISISPELAELQFSAYISALESAGLQVHVVDADCHYPDCVFIEDPAIVHAPRVLMARMTVHREGEQPPVEAKLRKWYEIVKLPPGAQLEGGDVLHIDETTYVGLSWRTNWAGAEALQEFLNPFGRRVIPVPATEWMHLKSVVTYLGNGTLVAAPNFKKALRYFEVEDIILTDPAEIAAANCLRIRDHLLIPTAYPATEERLKSFAENNGVKLVPLDISEFEKGEGSLTCLSIIW
jgi:dimethylargininase